MEQLHWKTPSFGAGLKARSLIEKTTVPSLFVMPDTLGWFSSFAFGSDERFVSLTVASLTGFPFMGSSPFAL